LLAKVNIVHIPYKGTPEALNDKLAGRVTFFFSPISGALPNIREGKLLALAVSTSRRSSALPNVPTVAESGFRFRLQPVGRRLCSAERRRASSTRSTRTRLLQTME
jgi:tripartite-type tricarboxylate transporter receptor subunit TctC